MIINPNYGEVVIDPNANWVQELTLYCDRGNPTACLIQTCVVAWLKVNVPETRRPKDVRVHIVHREDGNGLLHSRSRIGFTFGDYRYERPLTPQESRVAEAFDKTGTLPRRPLAVGLDTTDPLWTRKPKATTGGNSKAGSPQRKSLRARSLAELVKQAG